MSTTVLKLYVLPEWCYVNSYYFPNWTISSTTMEFTRNCGKYKKENKVEISEKYKKLITYKVSKYQ